MGRLLKVLVVVVVMAMFLDLMTEAKSSRSRKNRKSSRGERSRKSGKNRPENMHLQNVQFQNEKLLDHLRGENISISKKDLKNYTLIKKSCKRLLRKKLRCKNITDHEHFKRDALRRMAAFEALLHQSKHCLRKQRQVDEDQKVIEATLIAIRGFLVNTSERSANPWKYYCELPSGMCNRDTIREQLWIISTKLGEQLKCFVKILPTTSTPSDSDGETTPKPQKKRTRKDDRKRETNAKKELKAVFSSMLEKHKKASWCVKCEQEKVTLVVRTHVTPFLPSNSNVIDPIQQHCFVNNAHRC